MREKIDFPGEDRLDKRHLWSGIALGLPFYFLFSSMGDPLRGFASSVSIAIVAFVMSITRHFREFRTYWWVGLACIAAHFLFVFSLTGRDFSGPGMVYLPLVVLDMIGWPVLMVLFIRRFERS